MGECTGRPDDEASKVPTRSELQEVETPDIDEFNTWKVAEGLDNTVILVVDDERTTALAVTAVPELALACAELARVRDLDDIGVGLKLLEESDRLLRLLEALDGGVNNKRDLGNLLDAVSPGKDEGRKS